MALAGFLAIYCCAMRWKREFLCWSLPPGKLPVSIDWMRCKQRVASAFSWTGWQQSLTLSVIGKNAAPKCAIPIASISLLKVLFLFWFRRAQISQHLVNVNFSAFIYYTSCWTRIHASDAARLALGQTNSSPFSKYTCAGNLYMNQPSRTCRCNEKLYSFTNSFVTALPIKVAAYWSIFYAIVYMLHGVTI